MLLRNSNDRFGMLAITLHWVIALLIIGMLILGLYMTNLPIGLQKLRLYGWHKAFGLLVLGLVGLRWVWRLANTTPALDLPALERFAAVAVHRILYILMFAMPLSGWMLTSAAGAPPSFFGWFVLPSLLPADEIWRVRMGLVHAWLGYTLITVIALHTAAALKHYFINRDTILQRMLPW